MQLEISQFLTLWSKMSETDTERLLKKIEILTQKVASIDDEVKKSKSDIRKLSTGKSCENFRMEWGKVDRVVLYYKVLLTVVMHLSFP